MKREEQLEFLKEFTEAKGISGDEKEVSRVMKKYLDGYADEFDYLINAGISLDVKAISNPTFPLIQSSSKNLLKLYLNDVGLFTNILYTIKLLFSRGHITPHKYII